MAKPSYRVGRTWDGVKHGRRIVEFDLFVGDGDGSGTYRVRVDVARLVKLAAVAAASKRKTARRGPLQIHKLARRGCLW